MHSYSSFIAVKPSQPVTFLPWLQWNLDHILKDNQLQKLYSVILNNNNNKECSRDSPTDAPTQPVRKTLFLLKEEKHVDISLMNCGTSLTFLTGTKCRGHSNCYTTRKYENSDYLITKASRFWLLMLVVLKMLLKALHFLSEASNGD